MEKQRRIKIIQISPDEILRIFNNQFPMVRVIPQGIPEDAKVEAVAYDFMVGAFLLRVSHPSFENIEGGCVIPKHEGNVIVEVVNHG